MLRICRLNIFCLYLIIYNRVQSGYLRNMESLEKINHKTRKAYNKAAVKYYELFYDELDKKEYDKEFIDMYLKNFNSGSLICDLGCGPCGHIENYVFQKEIKIIGIDISERCIEIAKNQYPEIHFETGDFTNLNYNDNYFDGLISYYSMIDTPKVYMSKILGEFYRVLKKDGYLLVVV
jgi:ubiquinone/menaquinone biosynthesis C-methylase UbiE